MTLLGQIERGQSQVRHAFEGDQVAFFKSVRMIGEEFEESAHFAVAAKQGEHNNGSDPQCAAGSEIDARVGLGIIAAQQLAARNAFAGQAGTDLKTRAHGWGAGAGACATNHFASMRKSQGSAGCTRDVLGALNQQLEGGVEFEFAQGLARVGRIVAVGMGTRAIAGTR